MSSTPRIEDDLASHLRTWLQPLAEGSRVAVAGKQREWIRRTVADARLELTSIEESQAPESLEAVIWCVDVDESSDRTVAHIRRLMVDRGSLIVMAAVTSDVRVTWSRGSLPPEGLRLPRRIVHLLSEAGFAIQGERYVSGADRGIVIFEAVKDPFRIRAYRAGDEDAILRLFPTCFFVERGLDHWRWKYLDNPYGEQMISMAFSPEGELASHYASYPTPFWSRDRRDQTPLALQMGDTMTDPRFRDAGRGNRGLLPRTVRHFFSLHRNGRFGFFYGFNTGPIQRFCVRFIGGSKIAPVGYWTRDLQEDGEAPWSSNGYRVERVREVGKAWDRFFQRVAPHYGFLVRRDARWVDWRYLRCPDAEYVVLAATRWGRLVGWSVFRRRDDRLVWGDALFHPRHARAAESLLAAAVRRPELAGARQLEAWFSPRPAWWAENVPGLGLVEGSQPDGLGMVALEDGDDDAISRLHEMYYTMGDGDLF